MQKVTTEIDITAITNESAYRTLYAGEVQGQSSHDLAVAYGASIVRLFCGNLDREMKRRETWFQEAVLAELKYRGRL